MKKLNLNIISGTAFLVLSLLFSTATFAQSTTFPFDGFQDSLSYTNASARSTGLADADIALTGNSSSYRLNPALLSFIKKPVSFNASTFQDWRNNLNRFSLNLPIIQVSKNFRSTFRFTHSGSYISLTNPLGSAIQPEPDLNQYQLENGFAYRFSNVFSAGVLQTVSFTNNDNAQYWTYAAKAGLLYDPVGSLSYAVVVNGIGKGASYRFIEDGTTILGSYGIPVRLEIGATFSFPEDSQDPYFSLSLSNEKRFGETGVWYKGGMEIEFLKFLSVRSGIQFQPDRSYYMPRFGIGFQLDAISVDYGIAPGTQSRIDGRYHIIGITIHL